MGSRIHLIQHPPVRPCIRFVTSAPSRYHKVGFDGFVFFIPFGHLGSNNIFIYCVYLIDVRYFMTVVKIRVDFFSQKGIRTIPISLRGVYKVSEFINLGKSWSASELSVDKCTDYVTIPRPKYSGCWIS